MRRLVEIKGVGEALAAAFVQKGYHSVQDIAEATEAELATVPGVSSIRAAQLIRSAQSVLTDGVPPGPSSQASGLNETPSPFQAARGPSERSELSAAATTTSTPSREPSPAQPAGRPNGGSRFAITSPANDAEKVLPATGPTEDQSKEEAPEQRATSVSVDKKTEKKKNRAKKKKAKDKKAKAADKKKNKKSGGKKADKQKKDKAKNKKKNKGKPEKKKSGARKKK